MKKQMYKKTRLSRSIILKFLSKFNSNLSNINSNIKIKFNSNFKTIGNISLVLCKVCEF